jgi:hypothetical protein
MGYSAQHLSTEELHQQCEPLRSVLDVVGGPLQVRSTAFSRACEMLIGSKGLVTAPQAFERLLSDAWAQEGVRPDQHLGIVITK